MKSISIYPDIIVTFSPSLCVCVHVNDSKLRVEYYHPHCLIYVIINRICLEFKKIKKNNIKILLYANDIMLCTNNARVRGNLKTL